MDADLLKTLLDYVSDGVCLLDRDHRIVYWNRGAEKITGFLAQEVHGKHCPDQVGRCACPYEFEDIGEKCPLSQVAADGKPREVLVYIRHHQGHRVPVRMRAHATLDGNGKINGVAEVFTRTGAEGRKDLSKAARHSGHDPVTGAVNREYGELRLNQEMAVSTRFGLSTAWMRVDVDAAERLERNFGRGMMDATMQMIAHTVDANINPLDCLTRWDAHSFRVMLRHAVDSRVAELASRLALLVRTCQVPWWGEKHNVSVSIASVMACPDDNLDSLEQRVAETLKTRRGE